MGDVLHEPRSPRPAELDAWARARHRRDRARGSRQSDGRTGAETRLVKSWSRVGPFGARTAPLEPVKWRNRRAGCPTGGRGGLRDSRTRTIEERRQALSAPVSTPYNEILCGQPAPPPGETADGHHHPQARMTADALSRRRSRLELPALPAGVDAAHAAALMTRAARGDDAALAALERTAAWSRNTLRTYLRAWTAWTRWAAAAGVPAMPASSADVRAFVLHRVGHAGRSIATARADVAGIAAIHQASGQPSPVRAGGAVSATITRLAKARAQPQRQAPGLAAAELGAIRATARTPRRVPADGTRRAWTEAPAAAARRGVLDIALCSLLADAGLRVSEAAALSWADIARAPDGSGRVTVRRSKSDQEAVGAVVAITPTAMQDLAELRRGQPAADEAPVFGGLSGDRLARRIKAVAQAAGLGAQFSGHSGRVGMARRMVARGAPLPVVVRQGRWRPATGAAMVQRYTRAEDASAALPYLGEGA